jgi:uncharacterized protein YndB with AHSA1/START domain
MAARSVTHATFTVERRLNAPRARVFAAWSGPSLHKWFVPTGRTIESLNEFRVGGQQRTVFGPEGGPVFRGEGRYEDITENGRIVTAGSMHMNDMRASTTLCTIEFLDDGDGTRLILTDQTVYYMGDFSASRREGWDKILASLEAWLEGNA